MHNQTKHTPGPWKVDGAEGLPLAVIEDNEYGCGICVCEVEGDGTICGEANARLIAAAPDLLEALRAIVYGGNVDKGAHWLIDWTDIERARAAIAKAELEG